MNEKMMTPWMVMALTWAERATPRVRRQQGKGWILAVSGFGKPRIFGGDCPCVPHRRLRVFLKQNTMAAI